MSVTKLRQVGEGWLPGPFPMTAKDGKVTFCHRKFVTWINVLVAEHGMP